MRVTFCLLGLLLWCAAFDSSAADRHPRAMWIWNADKELTEAASREELFSFCRRENVGVLWIQISTEQDEGGARTLRRRDGWQTLIAEAHAREIRIEALEGDPRYALAKYHSTPLGIVDAITDYNRRVRKEERFDGVHFDNEPYLLRGWGNPATRESILRDFLELNREAQRRVHERSDMEFGVDIPFWWQSVNANTRRPTGDVAFNGKRQAASYHCIEMLDNVGIMDYRNAAGGTDGIIAHARDLLDFADKAKHAKLWIGVETGKSAPIDVWYVVGLPGQFGDPLIQESEGVNDRFRGFPLRLFDENGFVHVGLDLPDGERSLDEPELQSVMADLARRFGVSGRPEFKGRVDEIRTRAIRSLREDGEWQNFRDQPIAVPGAAGPFAGFIATRVMLPKLTFASKSAAEMTSELNKAEDAFAKYRRYAGIAVHHYESYRMIVGALGR